MQISSEEPRETGGGSNVKKREIHRAGVREMGQVVHSRYETFKMVVNSMFSDCFSNQTVCIPTVEYKFTSVFFTTFDRF